MHWFYPIWASICKFTKGQSISLSKFCLKIKKLQWVCSEVLLNFGLKLQKTKGVSPAVLFNLGLKLKKSQGVSPAVLSNLGLKLQKSQGEVQQFVITARPY